MANTPLYMAGLPRAARKFRNRRRLLVLGGVATLAVAGAVLGNGLSLAGKAQEGRAVAGLTVGNARLGVLTTVHDLPVIGRAIVPPVSEAEAPTPDGGIETDAGVRPAAQNPPLGAVRRAILPTDPEARFFAPPASAADVAVLASPGTQDREASQPGGDDVATALVDQPAAPQASQVPFAASSAPVPAGSSFNPVVVAPADPRRGDARAVARGDDAGAGDQEHADPRSTTAFQVVGAQATDPKPHEIDGDDTRSTPQFPSQPAGVVGREDGGPGAAQIVFPDAAPNSAAPHPEDFPHSGPNSAAIGPLSAVGGAGAQHVGQGQQGGSQGNGGHSAGSSHGGDH